MQRREPVITILGLTVSGNKGAESMLLSITTEMERRLGPCRFELVSVYPEQDRRCPLPPRLEVVSGKPLTMMGLALPLSLVLGPLRSLAPVKAVLRRIAPLRSILDCDLVIDSSGVAFMDGRGLPILVYNLSLCMPPVGLGRPVIKVSQALGPCRKRLTRLAARWALGSMNEVVARGEISGDHLSELGLARHHVCADTAFLMPVEPADRSEADALLAPLPAGRRRVGISPSIVVDDYCRSHGLDYASILADFIRYLDGEGFHVVLIPHSVRKNSRKRMNNDVLVCESVLERLNGRPPVTFIGEELRAPVLRALIGRMDFFIASRFHSMVSSLASTVPTLLVGWSHKYREVMRMFGMEDRALPFQELSLDRLTRQFARLREEEAAVREQLATRLQEVRRSAAENFDLAAGLVRIDGGAAKVEVPPAARRAS